MRDISIWKKLKKPIFILAPMEDVTDTVFRQIIAETAKPDLFFTEFTSSAGLCSKGYLAVKKRLHFTAMEKPIIAQIWGNNPKNYYDAAKMIEAMGFDGIDINMGCPVRAIISKGACGNLIRNHTLAAEIIQATKNATSLPVSVKTRIGFNKIETESWIEFLLSQDVSAITVHGRTVKELSKVPAHWDEIGKAVRLRDRMRKDTLIIGNGDVMSYQEGLERHKTYFVDGIMIGRGIFHDPWLFNKIGNQLEKTRNDRLQMLIKHIELFHKTWKNNKPFDTLKKFYKIYITDFPDAAVFRTQLMDLKTPEETIRHIQQKMRPEDHS